MESEEQVPAQEAIVATDGNAAEAATELAPKPERGLHWVLVGKDGLRAGWSIAMFAGLAFLFVVVVSLVGNWLLKAIGVKHGQGMAPMGTLIGESMVLIALAGAAALVAKIEGRRLWDYNLGGRGRVTRFLSGWLAGFGALSLLVGAMAAGGWLHWGAVGLSGMEIASYGALWGVAFLVVGCVEEGMFRCYLQFTLARGINLWIALGLEATMCGLVAFNSKAYGGEGVYVMALLGLGPALWAHLKKVEGAGFWMAAWVTSTGFGFIHTGNRGESWIGIFAAAFIGFVFCVSIKVTGSAWWAIGCHAAWDWAETYFYGTADSGFVAQGHLFSTSPAGNALWSGGTDGPEASLLVLPVIVLLGVAVVAMHGRRKAVPEVVAAAEIAG